MFVGLLVSLSIYYPHSQTGLLDNWFCRLLVMKSFRLLRTSTNYYDLIMCFFILSFFYPSFSRGKNLKLYDGETGF